MTKLAAFVLGLVVATGCGKKEPIDEVIDGLGSWKTKMCACTDKACADKVHDDYKQWENDVLEPKMKGTKKQDVAKDKMAKAEELDDARKECRRKFRDQAPTP